MSDINEKWTAWADPRNVLDKYKGWDTDAIKADVKKNSLPIAIMMSQIISDFNFSSLCRSANAIGARDIYYYGKKKFDPRGCQGVTHYSDITFLPSFDDIIALKERYSFVALENNINREIVPLNQFDWNTKRPPLVIVGEESIGIGNDVLDLCDHFVEILMRGSIRSINAAASASICLYDYASKRVKI